MKINNFTKCTLAIALSFGLNSLTVVEAADNTTETTSETINKSFIEQFLFAEKFTDKDGITAVRMKSPDVPLVNKEKGYSKEIVRVINYKQGTDKTVINRVYQYVRFHGAPVHEVPKDSPVSDIPEYNGGANPIDPPVLEKPKLEIPKESTPEKPSTPETPKESTPEKTTVDKPTNPTKLNPKGNKSQDNKKVLPNTGLESSSTAANIGTIILSVIGLSIFKRRKN